MEDRIDFALRELSTVAEGCADQILDLRDSALSAENPGRCVRCYFSIYHRIAEHAGDRILPLRRWLERHIEVVARGESDEEIERLPIRFEEGEDLRGFCERMMQEFRENRVYPDSNIVLGFDFGAEWKTAA